MYFTFQRMIETALWTLTYGELNRAKSFDYTFSTPLLLRK